jgi:putative DNA primase/helicase
VRPLRAAFLHENVAPGATGEVIRAAERLALIAAAGELATEWGITGWGAGEATESAKRCFQGWLRRRGTTGSSDSEAGFRQVRAFIAANGLSRFQPLGNQAAVNEGSTDYPVIRDRVGFRRWNPKTEEGEYLIFPDAFRNEICMGHAYREVLGDLSKRGLLVRDGKDLTIKPRLPELGAVRVYCIRAAILEGDDAGAL